jgi:hypothetical protein
MTTIPARKNDESLHAAAIERWDNEGGASFQIRSKKAQAGSGKADSLSRPIVTSRRTSWCRSPDL